MLTALKPSLEHDSKYIMQLLRLYGDNNQNKVANKTYSYRLFKKFNQASLKLFAARTFLSPRWWIHTSSFRNCLESMNNQTSVQDNRNFTEFRAPSGSYHFLAHGEGVW